MLVITKIIRSPWFLGILVIVFAISIFFMIPIEKRKYGLSVSGLTTDYTGLLPEKIERIENTTNRTELQKIVKQANEEGHPISIAGLQHSQCMN